MSAGFNEEQTEALWKKAQQAGMERRKFLALLAGGGAMAALAACAPRVTPAPSPTPAATPATTLPPVRLIDKPTPEQFFNPIGGGNVEMRFEVMANRTYATPNSFFFVRSHTSSPVIDVKTWKLSIGGDGVSKPFDLTYDDLLKMPAKTITRYVECAGNGRGFFGSLMNKPAQGGQWRLGAYGIAEWTGVQLGELLTRAGIKPTAVDVMPTGLDSTKVERPMSVSKAMLEDTIVAYMMNGEILPGDHGFPARVVTPGWVGIANIKWVGNIRVSEQPIFVEKNTTNYVFIGPDYSPQPPAQGPILTNQIMKSALCLPWPAALKAGTQKVVGYAWSPFGKIKKVDVSLDGGNTFQGATLTGPNIEKAGTRWEFSFDAKPGDITITPRATDEKDNIQYPVSEQKWNQLGYLFGAMAPHPVKVTA
ncbi:MAG: sulfite oxidase [Chloroflexi bacterium]|nr:sulfite oxidase [Chloroflexota bacterium]